MLESRDRLAVTPILIRMLEGRSGSTLVMQLLGTSPVIAFDRTYPFENSYLTYFTRLAGHLAQKSSVDVRMADLIFGETCRIGPLPFDPQLIDGGDLASGTLGSLWSLFTASLTARCPTSTFYAEKFWADLAPVLDAGVRPVIIDLVRDPRDLVSSVRAFNRKTGNQHFGRARAADDQDHLRRLTATLAFRFEELAKPVPVPRLELRYEDLVSDLEGRSALLGSFLDVHIDSEAVVAARPGMAQHMTSDSVDASVGRWRSDLAEAEISLIERRLGRHMIDHGYELALSPVLSG